MRASAGNTIFCQNHLLKSLSIQTKASASGMPRARPRKSAEARLVWDGAHNVITEETIGGENLIVHRHTANRAFDGKPVVVSGFNTTNSYIRSEERRVGK